MKNHIKKKVIALSLGAIFSLNLSAESMPEGWPWKGVDTMASVAEKDDYNVVDFIINEKIQHVRIHIFLRNTMKRLNISAQEALDINLKWSKEIYQKLETAGVQSYITIADFPVTLDKCVDKTQPSYWEDEVCTNQIKEVAKQTVEYFKESNLLGYEFMAEPVVVIDGKSQIPKEWRGLSQEIIDATRALGDNKYIFHAHSAWGGTSDYSDFTPFDEENIIYTAHIYNPHRYTHQRIGVDEALNSEPIFYPSEMDVLGYVDKPYLKGVMSDIMNFNNTYHKPLMITEFSNTLWSPNGETYIKDMIEIFNQQNLSWTYFTVGSPYYYGWDARFIGEVNEDGTKSYSYLGADAPRYQAIKPYLSGDINVSTFPTLPSQTPLKEGEIRPTVTISDVSQSEGNYCAYATVTPSADINDWSFKLHLPSTLSGIWGVDSQDIEENNFLITSQDWSRLLSTTRSHKFQFCGRGYAGDISTHDTKGTSYQKFQTKIIDNIRVDLSIPYPSSNSYCGTVKITNLSDNNVSWESVKLSLPDSIYREDSGWSGNYQMLDKELLITPKDWNRNITPDASRATGFCADGRNNVTIMD